MGQYYNIKEVEEYGTRVYSPLSGKQPRIPKGYRLVAVMDRLIYTAVPDVTDPDEFKLFYDQYFKGQFVTMDLYLIKVGNDGQEDTCLDA